MTKLLRVVVILSLTGTALGLWLWYTPLPKGFSAVGRFANPLATKQSSQDQNGQRAASSDAGEKTAGIPETSGSTRSSGMSMGAQPKESGNWHSDPLFGERIGAAQALGQSEKDENIPPLTRMLATDPDPRVRGHAITALSTIGTPAALAAMMVGVTDESPEVRLHVVPALGRFQDEWARETLAKMSIEDPEESVRSKATLVLSFLQQYRALPLSMTLPR
jgi:HEAT repeat protein